MSKRNIFDEVLASAPNSATAARVTGKGEHYDPVINIRVRKYSPVPIHSDAPWQCIPHPREGEATGFVNHTGVKYGRFTVIGYLGKLNPKKKASWLVRCVCGQYETRTGPAIRGANPIDCCLKCFSWRNTLARYEREGSRPIEDFTGKP